MEDPEALRHSWAATGERSVDQMDRPQAGTAVKASAARPSTEEKELTVDLSF